MVTDDSGTTRRKSRSTVLLVLTTVYGLLYVAFILAEAHGMSGNEPLVVRLLFALFLIGYAALWWNEAAGGVVFVLWWIGMWYLGFYVVEHDRGAGVVLGIPLFVLGVLFIQRWWRNRSATAPADGKPAAR